jgi:hypothetical protein
LAGEYTVRHNLIVNRLVEAIKLNCRIIGEGNENITVKITPTEGKMTNLFTLKLDQIFGIEQMKQQMTQFQNTREVYI